MADLMSNDLFRMGMGILEGATPQATPPNAISNMMRGMSDARDNRYQQEQRMLQKQQARMQLQQMKRAEEEHAHKLKIRDKEEAQLAALTGAATLNPFNQTPGFQLTGMGGGGINSPDVSSLPQVGASQPVGNNAPQTGRLSPYAQSLLSPLMQKENLLQIKLQNHVSRQDYITTQNALLTLQQDKAKAELLVGIGEKLPPGEREMFYQDPKGYMTNRMTKPQSVYDQNMKQKKEETRIGQSGYRKKEIVLNGIPHEQEIYQDTEGNQTVISTTAKTEAGTYVPDNQGGEPTVVPVSGGSKDMGNPKNWTADMRKASGFTNRMLLAENNINNVLGNDPNLDITDYAIGAYAGGGKLAGGVDQDLWMYDMDANQQQYVTAAMDWIRAKLRKESGAVISDAEMKGEYQTYFPVPGNTKEVIEQKRRARMQATRNMQMEASESWSPDSSMEIPMPKSQKDFDLIPRGAIYIDDDNKAYRKK